VVAFATSAASTHIFDVILLAERFAVVFWYLFEHFGVNEVFF
jgi:hypothetical protein